MDPSVLLCANIKITEKKPYELYDFRNYDVEDVWDSISPSEESEPIVLKSIFPDEGGVIMANLDSVFNLSGCNFSLVNPINESMASPKYDEMDELLRCQNAKSINKFLTNPLLTRDDTILDIVSNRTNYPFFFTIVNATSGSVLYFQYRSYYSYGNVVFHPQTKSCELEGRLTVYKNCNTLSKCGLTVYLKGDYTMLKDTSSHVSGGGNFVVEYDEGYIDTIHSISREYENVYLMKPISSSSHFIVMKKRGRKRNSKLSDFREWMKRGMSMRNTVKCNPCLCNVYWNLISV